MKRGADQLHRSHPGADRDVRVAVGFLGQRGLNGGAGLVGHMDDARPGMGGLGGPVNVPVIVGIKRHLQTPDQKGFYKRSALFGQNPDRALAAQFISGFIDVAT